MKSAVLRQVWRSRAWWPAAVSITPIGVPRPRRPLSAYSRARWAVSAYSRGPHSATRRGALGPTCRERSALRGFRAGFAAARRSLSATARDVGALARGGPPVGLPARARPAAQCLVVKCPAVRCAGVLGRCVRRRARVPWVRRPLVCCRSGWAAATQGVRVRREGTSDVLGPRRVVVVRARPWTRRRARPRAGRSSRAGQPTLTPSSVWARPAIMSA
jgi:hypothetical protein